MADLLAAPMARRSLRNVFSRPATIRYPVEVRPPVAGSRGMLEFDLATCVFCGLCVRRCPAAAISCSREERWFSLDALRCVACGACADACNKGSLRMSTDRRPVMVPATDGRRRPGIEEWRVPPEPEAAEAGPSDDDVAARAAELGSGADEGSRAA
ncbi:MAG TPA: 4Fe-4S binding protein [Candidatus Dormibacteraeota bacterium]|nr:4Fe-4S binding protein [Candidatus Dormibacteraeota bacterium]